MVLFTQNWRVKEKKYITKIFLVNCMLIGIWTISCFRRFNIRKRTQKKYRNCGYITIYFDRETLPSIEQVTRLFFVHSKYVICHSVLALCSIVEASDPIFFFCLDFFLEGKQSQQSWRDWLVGWWFRWKSLLISWI